MPSTSPAAAVYDGMMTASLSLAATRTANVRSRPVPRPASSPGLLALLLHTLRTDVGVPRRVLLTWVGLDEKQYGRWVRQGHRPDRRGREKLAQLGPHVSDFLGRTGRTWYDVIDVLPKDCRHPALRSAVEDPDTNPLLTAADLDADPSRGPDRPEFRRAQIVIAGVGGPGVDSWAAAGLSTGERVEPSVGGDTSAGFGLPAALCDVDAVDLVYAVVAAVCSDGGTATELTARALQLLVDDTTEETVAAHIRAYRAAVDVVARHRPAMGSAMRPIPGSPNTYLAHLDPHLAVAVVLADQELLTDGDLAEVLGLHIDFVPARVRLARRELLSTGWLP